jgi:hypothetical protein
MSDPALPSFRYRLEQQPPHTSCGGLVRGASVRQFPVSQGIAGASMRSLSARRVDRARCHESNAGDGEPDACRRPHHLGLGHPG